MKKIFKETPVVVFRRSPSLNFLTKPCMVASAVTRDTAAWRVDMYLEDGKKSFTFTNEMKKKITFNYTI